MDSRCAQDFDRWIRTSFVAINTELEERYYRQENRQRVEGVGDALKNTLRDEGHVHVLRLWQEGNTAAGFDTAFNVLGNVGLYLAALRRHELTNPAREQRSPFPEASSLALHVGVSLGVAPRFATGHLAQYNKAEAGVRKSFTSLADEHLFIDENTRSILLLQTAANALASIVPLGVSNPVADVLFGVAQRALADVLEINNRLFEHLDVDRFFYSVRPYYKPYRVGRQEYRGANAGDFSGINEIDLLCGVCQASDPYYSQLLFDKMLFLMPADQARMRERMTNRSLLDEFLAVIDTHGPAPWFQANATAFLQVVERFGRYAAQHHDQLVSRFIVHPAERIPPEHQEGLTASGPPLPVLLQALETLRDLRTAADRPDLRTRHRDLERLRRCVGYRPQA